MSSLLLRRRMMMQAQQDNGGYVTSIDGERIKVLQVIPKKFDPDGLSIHDEIYEENGKRYLKKQVREGITEEFTLDSLDERNVMKPYVKWRPLTSFNYNTTQCWISTVFWIDGIETCGWTSSDLLIYPMGIGIKYYKAFNDAFGIHNPNNFTLDEVNEMLSNKPFRYVVPEEEVEIIEIR